jgi:hypothetical protein
MEMCKWIAQWYRTGKRGGRRECSSFEVVLIFKELVRHTIQWGRHEGSRRLHFGLKN